MQRPPVEPKLHSSQIRTSVEGRTYESQIGLHSAQEGGKARPSA